MDFIKGEDSVTYSLRNRMGGRASFRGVEFHIESSSFSHKKYVDEKRKEGPSNPYTPVATGHIKRNEYSIRGHIFGPDYLHQKDRLIEALVDKSVGKLIHPYYSAPILVTVDSFSVAEISSKGGYASFDMLFLPTSDKYSSTTSKFVKKESVESKNIPRPPTPEKPDSKYEASFFKKVMSFATNQKDLVDKYQDKMLSGIIKALNAIDYLSSDIGDLSQFLLSKRFLAMVTRERIKNSGTKGHQIYETLKECISIAWDKENSKKVKIFFSKLFEEIDFKKEAGVESKKDKENRKLINKINSAMAVMTIAEASNTISSFGDGDEVEKESMISIVLNEIKRCLAFFEEEEYDIDTIQYIEKLKSFLLHERDEALKTISQKTLKCDSNILLFCHENKISLEKIDSILYENTVENPFFISRGLYVRD